MAKSKIIKNLVNGEIDLETTLYRLLVISNDLEDDALTKWIESELNGYSDETSLPSYRMIYDGYIKYTGINGKMQVTNQPLPLNYFSEKYREDIQTFEIIDGIRTIENAIKDGKTFQKDLTQYAGDVFKNSRGIQCINIIGDCNMLEVSNLFNEVKTKALKILMTLEKEFGNLDDLDIQIDDITDVKIKNVKSAINLIVFDNSISIGNDNQIKNSKFIALED